jgi:cobalt-precorrin 5A hydrolase
MVSTKTDKKAIWVITPNGSKLAEILSRNLSESDVYISQKVSETAIGHLSFQSLAETLEKEFHRYTGHIFIMSTGIVVRVIAPLIRRKTEDPAVVVVDDRGIHAISLLAGHLGGANELTQKIAGIIGSNPVITTATDVNKVPAIDVLAREKSLFIENPPAIKTVNMALLKGEKIHVHDPFGFLAKCLPNSESRTYGGLKKHFEKDCPDKEIKGVPGVYVDDIKAELPAQILILRPASLVAGIGCNRNTGTDEMRALLEKVLETNNLVPASLKCIASIDVKSDESGLITLAENLDLPLIFYNRQELNQVKKIKNPSLVVEKHVGVKSVCEAAAILAARDGALIVPKQSTRNVTVAIARIDFSS